jgi:P4 family phage/plasmid primase-like protien
MALLEYLEKKKLRVNNGQDYSHTSWGGLCNYMKFHIPDENYDEFLHQYATSFKTNLPASSILCITEKHKSIGPIVVDLDFRSTTPDRVYTSDLITNFIEKFVEIINGYVIIPDDITEVYILEKNCPRPIPSQRELLHKDGLHICIPSIVTSPKYQYAFRNDFLQCYDDIFDGVSITPASQVFDEAVIHKNNWFMYGSMKPDESNPWLITYIASIDRNCKVISYMPVSNPYLSKYVSLMSIRNKYIECSYTEKEITKSIHNFNDESVSHASTKSTKPSILQKLDIQDTDYDTVKALVQLLNPKRAENYHDWIRVGWCLHNIVCDEANDKIYLDIWIEFSKQSSKYKSGECELQWHKMHDGGIRVGSLFKWAKDDNPMEYIKIISRNVRRQIYKCEHNEFDVAMLTKKIFSNTFVSVGKNKWYTCDEKSNIWILDSGDSLSIKIATDIFDEFMKAVKDLSSCSQNVQDEQLQKRYVDSALKIQGIAKSLKSTIFKKNVLSECEVLMRDATFALKLDSKKHLLAFNNGVVDLNTKMFREIQPDDFISRYCEYDYKPWNELQKHPQMQSDIEWMFEFFQKVFPCNQVRDWKFQQFSQALGGHQYTNAFFNEVGTGSNGKTQLFNYLKSCFGSYYVTLNVNALIHEHSYNQGDPFLAETVNARLVVASEASENVKYNDGFIKAITGGDTLKVRMLHSNDVITIHPTFMLYLLTNNVPAFNGNDGGMTRRIKITRYISKFMEDTIQDDDKNHTYKSIPQKDLDNGFIQTRPILMSFLVDRYQQHYQFTVPEDIKKWTKEIIASNNIYDCFITACIQKTGIQTDYVQMKSLCSLFQDYLRSFNQEKHTKHKYDKKQLEEHIIRSIGPYLNRGYIEVQDKSRLTVEQPRRVYMGYKLNHFYDLVEDSDDEL